MIKMIDGIPCIILEDRILLVEHACKIEKVKKIFHGDFTDIQKLKSSKYFDDVREELKKKFREK